MAGTAAAASGVLTVMRTISEPARASSLTWIAVPITSAVSVLVIDCTTTGRVAAHPDLALAMLDQHAAAGAARQRTGGDGPSAREVFEVVMVIASLLEIDAGQLLARHQRQRRRRCRAAWR